MNIRHFNNNKKDEINANYILLYQALKCLRTSVRKKKIML